jgi:hypothetical protein
MVAREDHGAPKSNRPQRLRVKLRGSHLPEVAWDRLGWRLMNAHPFFVNSFDGNRVNFDSRAAEDAWFAAREHEHTEWKRTKELWERAGVDCFDRRNKTFSAVCSRS